MYLQGIVDFMNFFSQFFFTKIKLTATLDSTGPIDCTSANGCDIVSRQSDSQILHYVTICATVHRLQANMIHVSRWASN